jgi:archaellum component FlaF (FlaF/FlaG flagellin family)
MSSQRIKLQRIVGTLFIAMACMMAPALAKSSGVAAAADVAVTDIQIVPEVLMQEDSGTVRIGITNSGSDSVSISRAEILSGDLQVINYQTYDSVGSLGPGNSMEFTFQIQAGTKDGIFFPMFYLDFTDAGSLRYPIPIKVDDTPILITVIDAPDSFTPDSKEEIVITVSNPRESEINGVSVSPGGEAISSTQSAVFLGTLEPDQEKTAVFEIAAEQPTTLSFDVSYRNGANQHQSTLTLPVTIGNRKVAAELVVNNVEVGQSASGTTISGDITNAGLKDAKSVMVTVGDPAQPVDPNPVYVIGALEPDDFSSFEVTCTIQGSSEIPLIIEYRDEDGKVFEKEFPISSRSQGQVSQEPGIRNSPPAGNRPGGMMGFGSGLGSIPFLEIGVILVVMIGVLFAWRKGILARILNRIRDCGRE